MVRGLFPKDIITSITPLYEKILTFYYRLKGFLLKKPLIKIPVEPDKIKIVFALYSNEVMDGYGDLYTAMGIKKEMEKLGYNILCLSKKEKNWYDIPKGTHIVISFLHEYKLFNMKYFERPFKIAWVRGYLKTWLEKAWFKDYDAYMASSLHSLDKINTVIDSKPADLLYISVDTDIFKPLPLDKKYKADVVFTGSYWRMPRDIIENLDFNNIDYDLVFYGNNWNEIDKIKPFYRGFISYFELPKIYSSVKIVLDDHYPTVKTYGNINSRVFEALGCKAFIITNDAPGIKEIFQGGIVVYKSKEELNELIQYYLKDGEARKKIAQKGYEIVLDYHNSKVRASQFGDIIQKYKKWS